MSAAAHNRADRAPERDGSALARTNRRVSVSPETPPPLTNFAAECAVLGGMLIANELVDVVADAVSAADFADPLTARIFTAIVREVSLGRVANPVTLKTYFEGDADFAKVGGGAFLAKLTGSGAAVLGLQDIAQQVALLAQRRRLTAGLQATIAAAADFEKSTAELIAAADDALTTAVGNADPVHQVSGAGCIDELLASYEQPSLGVTCGQIPALDQVLGPLRPKSLTVNAGRPGMAKTACALSYGLGVAARGGGVLFVSLEMGSTELGARIASDLCFRNERGVPFEAISSGRLSPDQRHEVIAARSRLAAMPFHVADAAALTIGRLGMLVRRYRRRLAAKGQSLDLVIVDYLQLLHPNTPHRSSYEAVSEVSRGLKALAKDQAVAIMALAQLSRAVEQREDKRPKLSDLRDSGQIEQDADAVVFLYRDEYYLRQAEPAENSPSRPEWEAALAAAEHKIDFICAKRRNGRVGSSSGWFWAQCQAVRG